jgi:hypothetical protein
MSIQMRILRRMQVKRHRELGRGKYQAKQVGDEIIVTASGDTPTPNYKVWLGIGPERCFPPVIELWWMPPPGMQIQLLTPFSVHLTFNAGGQRIDKIDVRDADGMHEVEVEQGEQPGEGEGEGTAPPQQKLLANSFRLMHGQIPVSYATTSLIGEPIFTYGRRYFTGDELDIEDTGIGQQVTVVLEQVPDLKVVTFTLLVPPVLLDGTKPAKVEVPGIMATHHTTIAGPPLGQNISYELAMLPGVAEYIVA